MWLQVLFLIMSHLRPGKEKVYVSVLYFLKTCYGSVFICVFILVSCQVSQGKIFYVSLLALEKLLFICVLILAIATVFWFLSDVRSAKDNDHKFTSSWAWRRPPRGVCIAKYVQSKCQDKLKHMKLIFIDWLIFIRTIQIRYGTCWPASSPLTLRKQQ